MKFEFVRNLTAAIIVSSMMVFAAPVSAATPAVVLIVDTEAVFAQSKVGQSIRTQFEDQAKKLQAEGKKQEDGIQAEAKKLGVTITGYKDLLNPVLKGKIISADPAASSSAWNQLSTMLSSMGGYESKEAWDYVEALVKNLNGVMSSGSSGAYKGVFNGEYVVGITYESPCLTYIEDGYGDLVEIVYPVEGSNAITFASAIVKNAKNMDNAKLFMDWIASDEGQGLWATSTVRPANTNIPITNSVLTPTNKIKLSPRDNDYLAKNQQNILNRWKDLWAKHN